MSEISQTERVSDEELDQMIWKLERDGMTPKLLSLMRELRERRKAVAPTDDELIMAIEGITSPVSLVPEEAYSDDCPDLYPSQPDAWAAGWNSCRAAMLQTGNSPATPDGWIPVSERMPPSGGSEQRYVLAADFRNHYSPNIPYAQVAVYGDWFNDGNPTWDDGDGEDLHLKEVTHWMGLPAAPKEVG